MVPRRIEYDDRALDGSREDNRACEACQMRDDEKKIIMRRGQGRENE